MAQPVTSINLVAPGFKGLNTEDSPFNLDKDFATVVDNAVIDKYGRVGARKGVEAITTDNSAYGGDYVHGIHHFIDSAGNEAIFSFANNLIFIGDTTPADSLATSTTNDWNCVNFNDWCIFFADGESPMVYSPVNSVTTVQEMTAQGGYVAPAAPYNGNWLKAESAMAAAGRLWVLSKTQDRHTLLWSDLLDPLNFGSGTSGAMDLTKLFPEGYDETVGMTVFNGRLVVFNKRSIIVLTGIGATDGTNGIGGGDPNTYIQMEDLIPGVGCINHKCIQNVGQDVLFLSDNGLKSLSRTLQEQSMPVSYASLNVNSDIKALVAQSGSEAYSLYSPENAFYLLCFPSVIYCFDLRIKLETGAHRVTTWNTEGNLFRCMHKQLDGTVYIGNSTGICKYSGYRDLGESYQMRYYSPDMSFGDSTRLKFLKKLRPTFIGGRGSLVNVEWSYDFEDVFKTIDKTIGNIAPDYYGIGQFGIARYSSSNASSTFNINTNGAGTTCKVGIRATVDGGDVTIQQFNVITQLGRII